MMGREAGFLYSGWSSQISHWWVTGLPLPVVLLGPGFRDPVLSSQDNDPYDFVGAGTGQLPSCAEWRRKSED